MLPHIQPPDVFPGAFELGPIQFSAQRYPFFFMFRQSTDVAMEPISLRRGSFGFDRIVDVQLRALIGAGRTTKDSAHAKS